MITDYQEIRERGWMRRRRRRRRRLSSYASRRVLATASLASLACLSRESRAARRQPQPLSLPRRGLSRSAQEEPDRLAPAVHCSQLSSKSIYRALSLYVNSLPAFISVTLFSEEARE